MLRVAYWGGRQYDFNAYTPNVLFPPSILNEKFLHYSFFFQNIPRGLSFFFRNSNTICNSCCLWSHHRMYVYHERLRYKMGKEILHSWIALQQCYPSYKYIILLSIYLFVGSMKLWWIECYTWSEQIKLNTHSTELSNYVFS